MKLEDVRTALERAAVMLREAGIAVTAREVETMEIADFGLGRPELYGFEIVVYDNNDRYCAKEIVLFPRQTCPEHRHPPLGPGHPGKRETFRSARGEVYLYIAGEPATAPKAVLPEGENRNFTVWHERVLRPGDQSPFPPTASGARRASGARS